MTMPAPEFTVSSHFKGKSPVVRGIYDRLLETARRFGPTIEDPKKTSIHLVNTTAFAGIATRKDWIVLTVKSDRQLASARIHKTEQTSARRFHHEIKLASPKDVDAELVGWLKSAYGLSE
jgi:hypothetical protein